MAGPEEQLIGKTIAGCRIEKILGAGGMGVVYQAHQENLDAPVALKVIRRAFSDNENLIARFEREARGIAKLRGKTNYVVQVYDFGRDPDHDIYYISMEFVEGQGVDQILKSEGAIDPKAAAKIIKEAAEGLEVARTLGLVHRDIKPENLLLTVDGVTKITDFGLAKGMAADTDISVSGQILGTPAYMSPQQARGEKVDHSTDIYSLGASLYALLTGQRPYDSDTALGMAMKHVSDPVPDAVAAGFDVPEDLNEVIKRCMAKRPEDRYATGGELAHALEQFLWSRSTLFTPGGGTHDGPAPGPQPPMTSDIIVVDDGGGQTVDEAAAALNDTDPTMGADGMGDTLAPTDLTITPAPVPAPPKRSPLPLLIGAVVLLLLAGAGLWGAGVFDPAGPSGNGGGVTPAPPDVAKVGLPAPTSPASGAILTSNEVAVAGQLNGARPGTWVTVNGASVQVVDGAYATTLTLPDGPQKLAIAVGIGTAGHAEHTVEFFVDATAPELRLTQPSADVVLTKEATAVVAGRVTDPNGAPGPLTLRMGEAEVAITDDAFEVTVDLNEGAQTIALTARDAAAHETVHTLTITRDSTAPVLTLTTPAPGTTRVSEGRLALTGTVTDDSEVTLTINGEAVKVAADGAFAHTVDLNDGANDFAFALADAAGNTAERTVTLAYEYLPAGIVADGPDGYRSTSDGAPMRGVGTGAQRFFVDTYEVTVERYAKFLHSLGASAAAHEPLRWAHQNTAERQQHPVFGVSWENAAAYAKWAGKTLPTEAQWATAAGDAAFPWGDDAPENGRAVFGREPGPNAGPEPVGSAAGDVSSWGIHDLGGNLAEWCLGAAGEAQQPLRGGHWAAESGDELKIAGRRASRLGDRQYTVGFRCVRSGE